MSIKNFFSFRENRFFWLNIIGMIVFIFLLIYGVLWGLDNYTQHGYSVKVPNLKDKSVAEASDLLKSKELEYAVVDSDYVKTIAPGRILDQNPAQGQRVKKGRVVYLTINSLSIPLMTVPDVADNSSLRQAQAKLTASGFKLAEEEYITGEKEWVYGVKYNGRILELGEKVPIGAVLTLLVGNGAKDMGADSISVDTIGNIDIPIPAASEDAVVDDSWF